MLRVETSLLLLSWRQGRVVQTPWALVSSSAEWAGSQHHLHMLLGASRTYNSAGTVASATQACYYPGDVDAEVKSEDTSMSWSSLPVGGTGHPQEEEQLWISCCF